MTNDKEKLEGGIDDTWYHDDIDGEFDDAWQALVEFLRDRELTY